MFLMLSQIAASIRFKATMATMQFTAKKPPEVNLSSYQKENVALLIHNVHTRNILENVLAPSTASEMWPCCRSLLPIYVCIPVFMMCLSDGDSEYGHLGRPEGRDGAILLRFHLQLQVRCMAQKLRAIMIYRRAVGSDTWLL